MKITHIGDLIYKLNKELSKQIDTLLKDEKMSNGQLQTLMTIKKLETNGQVTQEKITKEILLDKSNICRSLQKLNEEKYITIEISENDARKNIIQLTQHGQQELTKLQKDLQSINKQMLKDIKIEEQNITKNTLQKMIENLKVD